MSDPYAKVKVLNERKTQMSKCVICGIEIDEAMDYLDLANNFDVENNTLVCGNDSYGDIMEWLAEYYG